MKTKTLFTLFKWNLRDYILFRLKSPISYCMCILAFILFSLKSEQAANSILMKADRFSETRLSRLLIKRYLDTLVKYSVNEIVSGTSTKQLWIDRTVILKDPVYGDTDIIEKGVCLIKFTATFGDIFRNLDLLELEKSFNIVLEPSWAGYCLPEILSWATLKNNVIVQSSDISDRRLLNLIDTNLKPVPFGSSDWVDPGIFYELKNEEKKYDVICIANFSSMKRPYVLVKVLHKLKSKGIELKAALVCASWGNARTEIMDLIHSYNLGNNLEIFESVGQNKLNLLLNRSKVNLLLSLKEGSNRVIFEGFFAGTPGIVLQENVGVNKSYLNSKTGACIKERDLPKTLVHFSKNWVDYDVRLWAMENISPNKTIRKLADAIVHYDPSQKMDFPIAPKVNAPEAKLAKGAITPAMSVQDLLKRYSK